VSRYQELLQSMPDRNGGDCGLGKILEKEGREKHDEVLEAIFAIDERTGKMYSDAKLAAAFEDEYGWSEYFFRRHRAGKCVSCMNRT